MGGVDLERPEVKPRGTIGKSRPLLDELGCGGEGRTEAAPSDESGCADLFDGLSLAEDCFGDGAGVITTTVSAWPFSSSDRRIASARALASSCSSDGGASAGGGG